MKLTSTSTGLFQLDMMAHVYNSIIKISHPDPTADPDNVAEEDDIDDEDMSGAEYIEETNFER